MLNGCPKILKALAFACVTTASSASNATVISDVVNPNPNVLVRFANSPYTYIHDFRDQGVPQNFRVNSASIEIDLYDDFDLLQPERATFRLDNVLIPGQFNVSLFGSEYIFDVATSMLSDGLLQVSLSAGCNIRLFNSCILQQDFYFARSELTADVTAVPEPAGLMLIGLGLAGLVVVRKRKV